MTEERQRTCNRTMSIDDDEGDNRATMRCQLPMGHDGPHQEIYQSRIHGKVTVSFEKGTAPVLLNRLKHIIPEGETCQFLDGTSCPFLAFVGMDEEWKEFACYLSSNVTHLIWPSESHKGCDQ